MKTLTHVIGALLLAAIATPVSAQTSRGYVSINALSQPANPSLSDHFEFQENAETATADVHYPSKMGIGADGGVGIRLWKQFGAGVAVSYVSSSGDAEIEASIPHPFVFGQPRAISGTQGGITRAETGVHLQLLYFVPTSGKLRAVLSGGPSFVSLQQDVVDDVVYTDAYPFDTAVFSRAATTTAKASAVGFNVGADIQWMFTRSVGVGALVRFTRAQVDLDITGRTLGVDTGGVQAGGGIRIGF
jgi:hypothetical protein